MLASNWSEYSHDILYLCSVFFVCLFVCLPFIQFMRFSWQVYWGGLSFPPPVDHVLLELSAMTRPSWVALHSMAHSFIELCKPLHHDKAVIHEGDHWTIALISQDLKIMLKILHTRLQHYVNQELTDVQAEFRKERGARDQTANMH